MKERRNGEHDDPHEQMRRNAYDRAADAARAAEQRLHEDYSAAARFIAGMMRELREAQAMVDKVNASLPHGAPRLPDVEAFRGRASRPPRVVDGIAVSGVAGYRPPRLSLAVALPGLMHDDSQAWPER